MKMKRNPPDCSLDPRNYGGDLEADGQVIIDALNKAFGDHWYGFVLDQCWDDQAKKMFWVMMFASDMQYIMPESAQLGLNISDNLDDIVYFIRTAGSTTPYQTEPFRGNLYQALGDGGRRDTGAAMLKRALELLPQLEDMVANRVSEEGWSSLSIYAVGADEKRNRIFGRFLKRVGYEPQRIMGMNFPRKEIDV
jgi:hypothetical protein